MPFEHFRAPLLARAEYLRRVARNVVLGGVLVGAALGIGVVGYHVTAGLSWIDSLLNASMILTGMGPVDPMATVGAKLFASFYALFSGVMFLSFVAILFAPVIHRFMHRFHLETEEDAAAEGVGRDAAEKSSGFAGGNP